MGKVDSPFDEAKYNALLDGLEAVELKLSKLLVNNEEFRFDSEFFKIKYQLLDHYLKSSPKLDDLVYMSDLSTNGSFKTVADIIHDDNPKVVPFIRSGNTGDAFIKKDELIFISQEAHDRLPKSTTKLHDIIMARKGKIGGATIIMPDEVGFNCNENVIKLDINDKEELNPFYFVSFFNSKFGLQQIERLSTGNVQPWVSIYQIRKLVIPIKSKVFQSKIAELINLAHKKQEDSKNSYRQSEQLLLKELDLLDFKPSKEKVAIKSFKQSFGDSGRLDSEYYQPKYDEIIEKIKSYKGEYKTLEYFSKNYSTGYPFKSDSYVDDGTYLIRINNIKKGYLDISNASKIPSIHKELSLKDIAYENDILISMSGTIGNTCRIPKGIEAVINQRIIKITPQNIDFEVLPLLINSIVGQSQLERIGTGGVQTNISSSDILNIIIPIIDKKIQTKIEEKIKESFKLKEESKQLLELAKKAVEIAIEDGEDTAMEFIGERYE